ncbi:MAG TPA: YhgE/Pip domain-containing protein [Candidatus Saccharimonadales bacterium]|nr:YhgE/Pip domain-containing protein [Candidatus Saccharimonadales bacterium]
MRLRDKTLKAEWHNINKQRILLVSLVVMLFIPIMYGGFFLGSIWDPYGNTKNLPVAVVNEDKAAELDGKQLHIGSDLVSQLRGDKNMGWKFVSANKAESGIANGTYYMRLVIPKNFSHDAATVTEKNPTKSTITYTLTPSRNYVASLLTKQAAESIAQTVSTNVSEAYVRAIFENINVLKSGMNDAASGASALASGSAELSSGVASYIAGVTQLKIGQSSLSTGVTSLSSGSLALKNGLIDLSSGLPTSTELSQLTDGVKSIQAGIAALNTAVQTPDSTITAQQANVMADAASLQQELVTYSNAATSASSGIAALQAAVTANQTTATVNAGYMLALVSSSQNVASQTASLLTDLSTLTAMLNVQQTTLSTNVAALYGGINTLSPNLQLALGGYTTVANSTMSLLGGASQLYNGSVSASGGSQQLLNGITTLNSSSPVLESAASGVADGSSELSNSLKDASDQLALQVTNDAVADQIVSPVSLVKTVKGDVPNYGYALSPYVLSLGLFVGALVFNVIYPIRRFFNRPKNALSWWVAKMSVAFAVSIGQALVLDAIMVFGLGLHPNLPAQFVLLSIVTSIVYMSIITLLVLALDNVGRFLAMLLLVLQLGSSEGVFPIVLSPVFFQKVNPFVPMTYSIRAYREAISSGLGTNVYWGNLGVLLAIAVVVNICLIAFLHFHGMRHFRHESIDD